MTTCFSRRWNAGSAIAGIWRYRVQGALLILAAWPGFALGAEQVSVEAYSQGAAVVVAARATIKAPFELIWKTLTDYDHFPEFIPGMTKTHVIERHGSAAIIEESGQARFLFFAYPIEVVVESREEPPVLISIRVLNGNLRRLDGGYSIERISDEKDEFVLRWSGTIEPAEPLLPFITVPLMRANISEQFRGMVKEIERREALRIEKQADK